MSLLMTLSVSLLLFNCHSEMHEKEAQEIKCLVTSPIKKDTIIDKEYVSQIHAIQHIEIRALERGYLQNIFVDEGQFVKEGQLMFRIMPVIYEAELKKAQAEAKFAEIEYLNTKALSDSNIVSKNELALAKAKVDKVQAELTLAQTRLQFTEIRAPFSGIMDQFHVRLGSLVNEGDLLTTLSDNSRMWVYFNVPEAEYLDYSTKMKKDNLMKVQLLMANNEMFSHAGIVETIEADFNNETGNIAFRATFRNPEGLLRHGETGTIKMPSPIHNKLLIPQKATFEILEKKYVFVVNKNGIVQQREIKINGEIPDLYIVEDGLSESEKIVLEGLRKIRDQDKITYNYQDPSSVLASLRVYAE